MTCTLMAGRCGVSMQIQRDKNHPSIILWSCGNESGFGEAHSDMARFYRQLDPSRPTHYEVGAFHMVDFRMPCCTSGLRCASDGACIDGLIHLALHIHVVFSWTHYYECVKMHIEIMHLSRFVVSMSLSPSSATTAADGQSDIARTRNSKFPFSPLLHL